MSDVWDDLTEFVSDTWDNFIDAVEWGWDHLVKAPVEAAFNLIGIDDESFLQVDKVTVALLKDEDIDRIQDARSRAAISMLKEGSSFHNWHEFYKNAAMGQMRSYYNFGKLGGYINGLPSMEVRGGDINFAQLDFALAAEVGGNPNRLSITTLTPTEEIHFQHELQAAPYYYKPWNNTLTHNDPYGESRTDYEIDSITYNAGIRRYQINISRVAEEAVFWIEGPSAIVEGDIATFTVKCNRTVPAGESVRINLSYAGTMLSHRYARPSFITMEENTDSVSFNVVTQENTLSDGNVTIIVTLDSVTNTNAAFEAVRVHTTNSVTTTVRDDEGLILTMSSHTVAESAGSLTIPVKLEAQASGPFTVDFSTINGTATGGVGFDFDNTGGTLNFIGNADEIQNIIIDIYDDSPLNDDNEYFTVQLSNCSDPAIDISQDSIVTITDGTDVFETPGNTLLTDIIYKVGYTREAALVVTYHQNTDPATEWYYWIYVISDGTYPDLSEATMLSNLDMMPVVVIKDEDGPINEDKTTEEYLSSKAILRKINVNINDMIAALEDNEDYQYVNSAYINFSLCPTDTEEIVSKGLWLSFYELIVIHTLLSNSNEFIALLIEEVVNNAIVWTEHTHNTGVSGTLPGGKEYHHEIEIIDQQVDPETLEVLVEAETILHLRHQTSPGIYEEMQIRNLSGISTIHQEGFHEIAPSKVNEDKFTIPVSYYVLSNLNNTEQMLLHKHILRMDIYAAQVVHLRWYETDAFATLFEIVSITVTIMSIGQASSFIEVLRHILFQWFVLEIAVFIAVETDNAALGAIVGFTAMFAFGDPDLTLFDFESAEGLIRASTNFANNFTAAAGGIVDEIEQEMEYINTRAEERLEEIREAGPKSNPITSDFLIALNSVDTTVFPAIKAQYDFDLVFSYDRLISNYYDLIYRTGVS